MMTGSLTSRDTGKHAVDGGGSAAAYDLMCLQHTLGVRKPTTSRMIRSVVQQLGAATLFAAAACRAGESSALALSCTMPFPTRAIGAQSSFALCLPPEFQRFPSEGNTERDAWKRGSPSDSTYAWISIHVLDSLEASREFGSPPRPRMLRDPEPPQVVDGVRADSVVSHSMTIDTRSVDVETALVSGGVSGMRRQPQFRAALPLGHSHWIIITGQAESAAHLDTLRESLASLRIRRL